MTNIYLIRHAEAEGNVFRRLQGQYNSMITPNGMRQIAALQKRFADIPIDAVYASDLVRTCTTAGAIYRPKGLPLHVEPRFREISVGCWENTPFGELDYRDHEKNYAFSHHPKTWSVEGSEPYAVYTARFLQALDEAAKRHDGQTIAIVAHGMVLRGSLSCLFFPDDERAITHAENTSVSLLHWENGTYTYEYLNDSSHITPEISTLGRQLWWRGNGQHDFNLRYSNPAPSNKMLLSLMDVPSVPNAILRLAYLVEEPVGALVVHPSADKNGVLDFFTLLPTHRGRGLSAQLLGEAICCLRACGCETMQVLKPVDNPAAQRVLKQYGLCGSPLSLDIIPKIR